jgi:REP element-mobilizing transposase RayT
MPRPLRFVPTPNALVEVTTRTIQSRLLLQPTVPINQAVVGVLGRAQKKYGMVVHFAVVLSNHVHLLLSPTDAKHLSEFMTFVNSNIAREVGRIVDWKEKFWGSRYHSIPVSDEREAQLGRLKYFLSNSVKENLVEHPFEWPGVHSARALAEGRGHEGVWFDRTAFYRAQRSRKADQPPVQESDFKTVETLELSPLPCLADLSENQQRLQLESLIAKVVADGAAEREAEGKMVLGVRMLQKQNPHTRPNRTKRSPAPRFHAIQSVVQKELRAAYSAFAAAFRIAAEKLRSGDLGARFPEGCFPPALPFCA